MHQPDWQSFDRVIETVQTAVERLPARTLIIASVNAVAQVGIQGDLVAVGDWRDYGRTLIVEREDRELVEFPVCSIHWIDMLDGPMCSQAELRSQMGDEHYEHPGEWHRRS